MTPTLSEIEERDERDRKNIRLGAELSFRGQEQCVIDRNVLIQALRASEARCRELEARVGQKSEQYIAARKDADTAHTRGRIEGMKAAGRVADSARNETGASVPQFKHGWDSGCAYTASRIRSLLKTEE